MFIEYISILSLLIVGCALLHAFGINGIILLPLGLICGTSVFILVGYAQATLNISSTFLFPLFFTFFFFSFLILITTTCRINRINKHLWFFSKITYNEILIILLLLLLTAFTVFLFYKSHLFKFHFDSYRYLITGSLLFNGNIDSISPNLLEKRFSSVAILHSLGNYSGNLHLHTLTPLLSISGLVLLIWSIHKTFSNDIPSNLLIFFSLIGPFTLLSTHGFVWHSFYINGHLLFGLFLLTFTCSGWHLVRNDTREVSKNCLICIKCFSIAGLVLTRPEGPLIGLFAILPFLFTNKISFIAKSCILISFGASVVLQQSFIIEKTIAINRAISIERIGLLSVGIFSLISVPFFLIQLNEKTNRFFLYSAEVLLWFTLLIFFINDPKLLHDSVSATIQNIVFNKGGWGYSIVIIFIITFFSLLFFKFKDQIYLRYCITTFIPLSFIMAYLRGASYRVGVTDSLNRMIMQILFLAVFFITVSFISSYLELKKIKTKS